MANGRSNELNAFMNMLDAELMCGICLELFRVPTILPCGHVFCRDCLKNVVESGQSFSFLSIGPPTSFNCPVCQKDINVSKNGIDNLPVNKSLESIISIYHSFSPIDIFDLAWNRDLTIDISTCPDHREPMSRYCESCSTAVCKTCEKEEHRSRHRVKTLREVASILQADIADTLTELKKRIIPTYTQIASLESMLKRIEEEENNLKKYLCHCVDSLKSTLRAKQEELSDAIHSKLHLTLLPVTEQLRKCKQSRTNVQEMMRKLSAIRKVRDVNHRIKLMKDSIDQLNNMLQNDYDCVRESTLCQPQIPDMKLDTREITIQISILDWIDQDKRKKIMCNKYTQTESRASQTDSADTDYPTLDSERVEIVRVENNINNSKENSASANSAIKNDNSNQCSTDIPKTTQPIEMKHNAADINTTEIKSIVEITGTDHEENVNRETLTPVGNVDRILNGDISGTADKHESSRKQELVTNGEINAITNDMSAITQISKDAKSTERRSFPFDFSSNKCGSKEEDMFLPSSHRNTATGSLVNVDVRTSPRDSTSEALANFVARRRTLSPFTSGNSNRRVSTSPLASSPSKTQNKMESPKDVNTVSDNPERALSPKNYSKEPITVKLAFETDV